MQEYADASALRIITLMPPSQKRNPSRSPSPSLPRLQELASWAQPPAGLPPANPYVGDSPTPSEDQYRERGVVVPVAPAPPAPPPLQRQQQGGHPPLQTQLAELHS